MWRDVEKNSFVRGEILSMKKNLLIINERIKEAPTANTRE